MFRVGNYSNRYAIKELFEIYFCTKDYFLCEDKSVAFKNERTECCYDTINKINFSQEEKEGKNYFVLTIEDTVGNIEDWFKLINLIVVE